MKFLEFNRVLCLSPHPDDVEYSLAGTVLKYTDTVFDILCLTQGGDCDQTTDVSRLDEVKNSWAVSNANNYNLAFTSYRLLKELDEDKWISLIERDYINVEKYDAIILPSTQDSHFEHRIVSNFGWPLTRIKSISLVEYCSPSTLETWVPNVFVDIKDQFNVKLNMLKQFTSQQHRSYFKEDVIKGFHTNFQCSKKGLSLVEQFNLKQVFLK